ncbi:ABC transporter substrate-binding protein [Pedomonas sp. V897]|uniref:ABC transporter substrate-binding protein n=1 Tax=Pedomonas sp. V897 TaxID=3446482 RepID=UPI003EE0A1FB
MSAASQDLSGVGANMKQGWRVWAMCSVALHALVFSATVAQAAPARIVSLNMCADQYLVALADKGQIAALTRFARDPVMSAVSREAAALPYTGGTVEEVLKLKPDLVIASSQRRVGVAAHVAAQNIPIQPVHTANSYEDIKAQIRDVASAVGHTERGEALIRQMEASLADIHPAGRGRVAAYYQRRGFMTGTGTLVDEMMRRAGLENLAERLGKPVLAQISLEEIVAARPDFLIVEADALRVTDQGTEMLQHPALAHIPRLVLPQSLTVCGGPTYVEAVRQLVQQIEAHDRQASAGRAGIAHKR